MLCVDKRLSQSSSALSLSMVLEIILGQGLCQNISNLIFCFNRIDFNESQTIMFAEAVVTSIDVFGSRMEFCQPGKFKGA